MIRNEKTIFILLIVIMFVVGLIGSDDIKTIYNM